MNPSMRFLATPAVLLACVSGARAQVVIETVTVGNPGNAPDTRYGIPPPGYPGSVPYLYNIGKFEVTAGQYTDFLNAVAATDTHGLYNTSMGDPTWLTQGCNIQRSGSPGSYSYSVAPDSADRPVNYVSWGDAARFANWLHNGQPTGAQDLSTTEGGSYYLNGATSKDALMLVNREADAAFVVPSEDEWYKAAYYKGGGIYAGYWDYPTGSDGFPSNDLVNPDPGNNANFYGGDADYTIGQPYWRTEVGDFENSASPYGTFDQGGNVSEWIEEKFDGLARGLRGGDFAQGVDRLHAASRGNMPPAFEAEFTGFRVAWVGCEDPPTPESECDDGIDNDCDGLADCADPDCKAVGPCTVPAVSTWSVALAGLVLLTIGTLALRGRRRARA